MHPKTLSDDALLDQIQASVLEERQATICVLRYLREVEKRMLYAKRGFSNIHLFCVKALKYSEAAASRRISSMRLLRDLPELEACIESGELNLSVLSMTQGCLRREGLKPTLEFFEALRGKTLREAKAELARRFPQAARPEQVTTLSETRTEIRFTADSELYQNLIALQERLGKPGLGETIAYAVKTALKKPTPRSTPPASEATTRHVPAQVERAVRERDGNQCTYQDPKTGRRCGERFGLELDHVIPVAHGGKSTVENLAMKCRAHNRMAAVEIFGAEHMSRFYSSIR